MNKEEKMALRKQLLSQADILKREINKEQYLELKKMIQHAYKHKNGENVYFYVTHITTDSNFPFGLNVDNDSKQITYGKMHFIEDFEEIPIDEFFNAVYDLTKHIVQDIQIKQARR
jgi:hypothetical protein